ncbi:alanine racemase [soil metagenome]
MPTATIDLSALSHNLGRVRQRLQPGVGVMAAVKADAYGHGSAEVARRLAAEGVAWLGVATAEEALSLRRAGVTASILVFSPVYERLEALIDHGVALTVVDESSLGSAAEAADRADRRASVHIKVDTGMGRLGKPPGDVTGLIEAADRDKRVEVQGLWTHFACADDDRPDVTRRQIGAFSELVGALEHRGLDIPLKHAANSAAICAFPEAQFDLVRPGIALYGYHSSPFIAGLEPALRPVMTLTAPVTFVKRVRAGAAISYGALWHAPQATTVATVRIGYADGYPRALSGKARVGVHGRLCPVAGRICMDQLMVDVGDLGVRVGDRGTRLGGAGPSAEDLGELAGTISYELLTGLGARVRRIYQRP